MSGRGTARGPLTSIHVRNARPPIGTDFFDVASITGLIVSSAVSMLHGSWRDQLSWAPAHPGAFVRPAWLIVVLIVASIVYAPRASHAQVSIQPLDLMVGDVD